MRIHACALAAFTIWGFSGIVRADVPRLIPYQVYLADGNGSAMAGPVNLEVRFYDTATGDFVLFSESHAAVPLVDGVFTIHIGSQTAGGVPDSAFDAPEVWLALSVDGGAELSPRVRIGMVPFAAKARSAEQLVRPDTFTPAVTVQSTGTVSVGDTLSVAGRGLFDDSIYVESTGVVEIAHESNTGMEIDPVNLKLHLQADNTRAMTLTDRGNVGIGTTNPADRLHVFGGNVSLEAEGFDPYIELISDSVADATTMRLLSLDTIGFAVADSRGTPRMVVREDGRVGIGTTAPTSALHLRNAEESIGVRMKASGSWTAEIKQTDTSFLSLINGGSERLTIAPNGNIGIGTTAPSAQLDIHGGSGNNDNIQIRKSGDLGADNARFALSHRTNGTELWVYGTDTVNGFRNLQGWDYANNRARFPANGDTLVVDMNQSRVGIGTTAPSADLDIQGTSSIAASINQSGTSAVALTATYTGTSGNAGLFGCSDNTNSETALSTIHAGPGKAFLAYNYGTGKAAEITIDNPSSTSPALMVTTSGTGPAVQAAGLVESTTGGFKFPDGTVQTSAADGGGITLPYSETINSSSTLFNIVNSGTGSAITGRSTGSGGGGGFFQITSSSNTANALTGSTFGSGKGVAGFSFGTGPAGYFEVNNILSTAPAIHAKITNGNGYAIVAEGAIQTDLLEITGGADLAEPFDVAGDTPEPGSVVVIDVDRPGRLKIATQPYDRTVAGIISGAGGVRPGMVMAQTGTAADGQHRVALTGRVYCLCDASHGPIRPGDLLTTSDTPGHAMRVNDYDRAQGAIIGKAMTALEEGRGLVLVLVSLQ